jgi:hypothetical protein
MEVIFMSTEVVVAQAVATVASDKRGRVAIATILCAVIMLFFLPLIVYMGVMSNISELDIDTAQAQEVIVQNMSKEEKEKLTHLENVMNGIANEFKNRELTSQTRKAQALYACALYDAEKSDSDFITKLADCYETAQTDEELRNAILSAFGVEISADDFNNLMSVIKNTVIDIDLSNTDKNNLDLVKWAEFAYDNGWGYVWGSHGEVLTESKLNSLKKTFGSHVTDKEDYIRANWLGKRTADCVGLIKGYGWYDDESGTIKYGTNGMKDVTADGMYSAATEKGPISTMPDIPGIAVWHQGHIGIYIGNGYVIHAANTYDGVIKTPITSSGWTHWLKIPYINYIEETEADNS